MPNHIDIKLSVYGLTDQIEAFKDKAKGEATEYEANTFEFNNFIPVPQILKDRSFGGEDETRNGNTLTPEQLEETDGYSSMSSWCNHRWGTKWGAYNCSPEVEIKDKGDDHSVVTFAFRCAWANAGCFIIQLSVLYPDLLFVESYGGEGPAKGRGIYFQGGVYGEEVGDYNDGYPDCDEEDENFDEDAYWEEAHAWISSYLDAHEDFVDSLINSGKTAAQIVCVK
jgi:hypothetical protein